MVACFKQTRKDLFAADFVIEQRVIQAGRLHLKGSMTSYGGRWTGGLFSRTFEMYTTSKRTVDYDGYIFRPNGFLIDSEYAGQVFQTAEGKSFSKNGYEYHKLFYVGGAYEAFPIGLGEDGYKTPVYHNGRQIALIEKGIEVVDDLHMYEITAIDDNSILIACIFCCYMYVIGPYKPGEKAIHSRSKSIVRTKNEAILAKYDPSFKEHYAE